MNIRLNGEPRVLDAPLTVAELLEHLGIDSRRVAVERNLIVVKRVQYPQTLINDGDEIEIVNFVGGGACGPREAPEGSSAEPNRRARASGGGAPRAVGNADSTAAN